MIAVHIFYLILSKSVSVKGPSKYLRLGLVSSALAVFFLDRMNMLSAFPSHRSTLKPSVCGRWVATKNREYKGTYGGLWGGQGDTPWY